MRHDVVSIFKQFWTPGLLVTWSRMDEGRAPLQIVDEYLPTEMLHTRRIPSSGIKTLQNNWKQLNYNKTRLVQQHLQSAGMTCIRRRSERANDIRICVRQKSIAIRKHHRIIRQQQIIIIVHISIVHNTKYKRSQQHASFLVTALCLPAQHLQTLTKR